MQAEIHNKNMPNNSKDENGIKWYPVNRETFDIYGLIDNPGGALSRRLPETVAKELREKVLMQAKFGAGGRVLFSTDSPFIAVKAAYGEGTKPTVCNHCISYGFDLYRFDETGRDVFTAAFRPGNGFDYEKLESTAKTRNDGKKEYYTINMPHFAEVREMYIGLQEGSILDRGKKYRNNKPIVFYGSSITHGAAAGRPGNTYESFISQKYNLDYTNLGFAGNAKGEPAIAEYISGLDMSVFVLDYDHNAPDPEYLKATHYPFFEIIRKKQPGLPIVMVSKPDCLQNPKDSEKRRAIIAESYNKARLSGDNNVYFIDGGKLFSGEFSESCTSDGIHPNDIGFYRMADGIGKVLAEILGIK